MIDVGIFSLLALTPIIITVLGGIASLLGVVLLAGLLASQKRFDMTVYLPTQGIISASVHPTTSATIHKVHR